MTSRRAYSLMPPYRRRGSWLKATGPERRAPAGYASIPGYDDRIRDVRAGRTPPFWGTEYELRGGPLGDMAMTTTSLDTVSDRLRHLLENAGVGGLAFYPIVVDGATPMWIMAVRGVADADREIAGVRLRDGAEAGLYKEANLYVSLRIASLIQAAKLDVSLTIGELPFSAREPNR